MTLDLDAELRAALDEAVADVRPTDALWRRIEASTEAAPVARIGPPVRHPSRRYLVLAVAAGAALLAGAVALWQREAAAPVVQTNPRPVPSVVTTPPPTPPPAATPTSTPGTPPTTEPRPTRAVAMLQDGRMVEADLVGGKILRVLGTRWDARQPPPTGDIAVWGGVDVDAGGKAVWFTDCCPPAHGNLFRAPLDAWPADPRPIGRARAVAVSPDGTWVARVGDDLSVTTPTGTVLAHDTDASARAADMLWWSPDGRQLAYRTPLSSDVPHPDHEIHLLRWDGRALTADPGLTAVRGEAIRWDGGRLVVLPGRPLASRTSADGAWTLVVDQSGGLHMLDAAGSDTRLLPGLAVADADPIEVVRGS
jgi:hypothetical protein